MPPSIDYRGLCNTTAPFTLMSSENQIAEADARVIRDYVPIQFHLGIRERYLGWKLLRDVSGLRVSSVRRGPVTKVLVLSRSVALTDVSAALSQLRALGPLSILNFHDFSAVAPGQAPELGGRQLRHATQAERCVNIDTFVFDLHMSQDTLWQRLQSNARRNIKKAESLGATVRFTRTPTVDQLDGFFAAYTRMAEPRRLPIPSRRDIERMFHDNALILAHCADRDGHTLVTNLTYVTGDAAIFLHGASSNRSRGEGQLVHWETTKHLQAEGLRWYDLGGIATRNPDDGIFRFKKSMGATLVPLGVEYLSVPWALVAPLELVHRARRLHGYIGSRAQAPAG